LPIFVVTVYQNGTRLGLKNKALSSITIKLEKLCMRYLYSEWKKNHQLLATPEQLTAFEATEEAWK
jgi:hypothetical protein